MSDNDDDVKCERCGAIADFEIRTSVVGISQRGKSALSRGPTEKTIAICMPCTAEIGPEMNALVESPPELPGGKLQ